jgi:hypothetical protein
VSGRQPRTDWSENAPAPGRRGLSQEWYTRILLLCVLCSIVSATGVVINGSLGKTVVKTEQRSLDNLATLSRVQTAIPGAKREASRVARKEATKVAKTTRRVVLREARTVFARQIIREIGKRGATGRPPTLGEIRAAVVGLCATTTCFPPISVEVVLLALKQCVADGGCGALRGPTGADGTNGADGKDGKDAPPVSDARLDERFALYCAMVGGCKGDKGDPGPLVIPPCASLDPSLGYACLPPPPSPAVTTPQP